MKLHSFHRELPVPQAHDHLRAITLDRVRADFQFRGQLVVRDDQRVIARRRHRRFQALEDGLPIMLHPARLAVHDVFRPNDLSSKSLANRLMSQANAQHGHLPGEVADQLDADPGVGRRARARRNHDALGAERLDFRDADLVVAAHLDLRPQLAQILHQVVGKRVVIVENEDHGTKPLTRAIPV